MSGSGRARPQEQLHSSPAHEIRPPQLGQLVASILHRWPVDTQVTLPAAWAAHTTRGSSQLATTWTSGRASSDVRHFWAASRTSP